MIWHRSPCFREINDQPQEGGLLICADTLQTDLSQYEGQAQAVFLDPPGVGGAEQMYRLRIGEHGWQTSRHNLLLPAYRDFFAADDPVYLDWLRRMLQLSRRLLSDSGSMFLHLDADTLARARLMMDEIFGADNFKNQIIWSYQTGGRTKRYFSRRHDVILFYAKSAAHYFDITQVPVARKEQRSNHMKRHVDAHGRSYRSIKTGGREYIYYDDEPVYPDDVWADVSQMQQKDPQRTGYPKQKPQALLDRMLLSTTRRGDLPPLRGNGGLPEEAQGRRQAPGVLQEVPRADAVPQVPPRGMADRFRRGRRRLQVADQAAHEPLGAALVARRRAGRALGAGADHRRAP